MIAKESGGSLTAKPDIERIRHRPVHQRAIGVRAVWRQQHDRDRAADGDGELHRAALRHARRGVGAREQLRLVLMAAATTVARKVRSADPTILGSALLVGGIWIYRRLVEPAGATVASGFDAKTIAGLDSSPAAAAQFVPAFAFVYITLALIGMAEPDAARSFAVLVAVGDVLANGVAVFSDVGAASSAGTSAAAANAAQVNQAAGVGPLAPSPSSVRTEITSTVTGTGTYVTPSGRLTTKAPTGTTPTQTAVNSAAKAQGLVFDSATDQYVPA